MRPWESDLDFALCSSLTARRRIVREYVPRHSGCHNVLSHGPRRPARRSKWIAFLQWEGLIPLDAEATQPETQTWMKCYSGPSTYTDIHTHIVYIYICVCICVYTYVNVLLVYTEVIKYTNKSKKYVYNIYIYIYVLPPPPQLSTIFVP